MSNKPALPKGMRDFGPATLAKRNYVISCIKKHFKRFGFNELQTPSIEKNATLLGKYGDEGDRLIFRILNSGDFMKNVSAENVAQEDSAGIADQISEKSLRYDLTVPFARFVAQHQHELTFPFKRFQIQPVWRADRPQKGRYREFYQCDADAIGSKSLWYEIECINLYREVFHELNLNGFTIHINHRKLLAGLAELIGQEDKLIPLTVALDKLDKIGKDKVEKEMIDKGITEDSIQKIQPLFDIKGDVNEQLGQLEELFKDVDIAQSGVDDLRFIWEQVSNAYGKNFPLELNVTLARGLDYYTGTILEVKAPEEVNIGSIGGGGRYDDLTGVFGLKDLSGMGISFGLDRIYLCIEALDLFPEGIGQNTDVLFINFNNDSMQIAQRTAMELRRFGIAVDIYPDSVKLKKQFQFADKNNIPYVIVIGEEELQNGEFSVKDMKKGDQRKMNLEELKEFLLNY
mgnify:FL=1